MTNTDGTTAPATTIDGPITITVDLDDLVHRAWAPPYDAEDPGPAVESLADHVVAEAGRQIADRMSRDIKTDIHRRITQRVESLVDECLEPLVAEALERAAADVEGVNRRLIRDADDAEPVDLAGYIVRRAEQALKERINPRDPYSSDRSSMVERLVKNRVDVVLSGEFREALEEGRKQVRSALREKGAELLQEAIERQATNP